MASGSRAFPTCRSTFLEILLIRVVSTLHKNVRRKFYWSVCSKSKTGWKLPEGSAHFAATNEESAFFSGRSARRAPEVDRFALTRTDVHVPASLLIDSSMPNEVLCAFIFSYLSRKRPFIFARISFQLVVDSIYVFSFLAW